ncbi:MAG: fimbrillin family protein [Bacteroidales bacterium]
MKKSFLFGFAAAVALASCTTNEDVLQVSEQRDLAFGTFVDKATKGAVGSLEFQNSTFGVWGYYVDGDDFTKPTSVFGTGITKVTRGEAQGSWAYEGTQKWIPAKNYRFHAYAPHDLKTGTAACDAANVTISGFTVQGTVTDGVMPYSPAGHVDLMVAQRYDRDIRTAFDNSKIGLTFKHILTNVNLVFNTTSKYQVTLHDVKLNGIKYAGSAACVPATDGVTSTWTSAGNAISFAGTFDSANKLVNDGVTEDPDNKIMRKFTAMADMLMIPQAFSEEAPMSLYVKYKVGGEGEMGADYYERTIKLSEAKDAWTPGKKITYNVTITTGSGDGSNYDIIFGETTTTDWVKETPGMDVPE